MVSLYSKETFHHITILQISLSAFRLKFKRKSQDVDIEREIREVSTELMKNEINMRRSRAIEVNKKMKNVLDAWLGASVLDIFHEWKRVLYRTKAERQKSKEFEKREQKRLEQENNEQLVLAKKEVSTYTYLSSSSIEASLNFHKMTIQLYLV